MIPTSTHVVESALIEAPLSHVWTYIKLQHFDKFWSTLSTSRVVQEASDETDIFSWEFKDGTVLQVKQEASSSIDHFVTYSVIAATPGLSYHSVLSTIRLYSVTSGKSAGSTYIEWSASFSSDADTGVLEDARFKRKEALADLAKTVINSKA